MSNLTEEKIVETILSTDKKIDETIAELQEDKEALEAELTAIGKQLFDVEVSINYFIGYLISRFIPWVKEKYDQFDLRK